MIGRRFKYIFGPVYSWRLGVSLGIDPIYFSCDNKGVYKTKNHQKICNFDCRYCQLGPTRQFFLKRQEFVPVRDILEEITAFSDNTSNNIDYYTFSGAGEPCLASNLGEMIRGLRKVIGAAKIAVITNSSFLEYADVRQDLCLSDCVLAKLDVCNQELMESVNHPAEGIRFDSIIKGIELFKKDFSGRLALQIMFIEQNQRYAKDISDIVRMLKPDEIQLNTPLRPSAVSALTREQMDVIRGYFKGMPVISVYDVEKKKVKALNIEDTTKRHGLFDVS